MAPSQQSFLHFPDTYTIGSIPALPLLPVTYTSAKLLVLAACEKSMAALRIVAQDPHTMSMQADQWTVR